MKIIDVTCAVGAPLKSNRFTTVEGLMQWMDDYRIDSAVVYHAEAIREPEMGNSRMMEIRDQSSGRIRLSLAVNPSLQNLGLPGTGDPVERMRAARPSTVSVFPDEQSFLFDTFYASDILDAAQALRMPLTVRKKSYDKLFLSKLPEVCMAYPEVPIILPRFGLNFSRFYFPMLKKLPNLYLDMSTMLDVASLEEIVERFGSEHLLFGSGMPTYEPSGAFGLLHYANIPQKDLENITHGNFERLEGEIRR